MKQPRFEDILDFALILFTHDPQCKSILGVSPEYLEEKFQLMLDENIVLHPILAELKEEYIKSWKVDLNKREKLKKLKIILDK